MDFDRKSAVSSFYGGRRSSFDALNSELPAPSSHATPSHRARVDSSSSFFNPDAVGAGPAVLPQGAGFAGYNRMSYMDPGRVEPVKGGYDEEEAEPSNAGGREGPGWDIYADFNNAGPRYSTAFRKDTGRSDSSYREIGPSAPRFKDEEPAVGPNGPVEMVTVPTLGPEWKADELYHASKMDRKEEKWQSRKQKWKAWNRNETGLCGSWFTRKFTAWFMFAFLVVLAVVLAITLPRVPAFAFNSSTPLINATGSFAQSIPYEFSRAPANFSFPAFASLELETSSNFVPMTLTRLDGQVFDLNSGMLVGTGSMGKLTLPAKSFIPVQLPLNFTYIASNDSDPTWANWYNACKNTGAVTGGIRPGLQFRIVLQMTILGLIGHPSTSTQVTNAPCPWELPINAA
ncbi:hypothetical protein JAAARDRAFT_30001 [Jaapia argillacea MUCL 33604]|uniref:Uncharacterized protein n=1 Tax=Jaapia argillacea MUCL 33604 TaxID=933084 RepID=A0A067QF17_9AGAM|nr:hypothetical protein JAAARDRAFT_30001 [Jaapia argillacea MUCL 33604]